MAPDGRNPRSAPPIPERVARRALEQYELDPDTGCHVSTYSVASHGYAQVGWKDGPTRAMTTAHRAAWTAVHGRIPDGMTVDHVCKNRRCVNVQHLRLLSNFENGRRTKGNDWPVGQCVNGHPNSELRKRGKKWVCGPCAAQWQRDYRARKS